MLEKFSGYALKDEEQKAIVGGQKAYCTNGNNAACYESLAEALDTCGPDDSCTGVTPVTF